MPVALTRLGAPVLDVHRPLPLRKLYEASPVGLVGAGVAGLLVGSFYGMGAVFALALAGTRKNGRGREAGCRAWGSTKVAAA